MLHLKSEWKSSNLGQKIMFKNPNTKRFGFRRTPKCECSDFSITLYPNDPESKKFNFLLNLKAELKFWEVYIYQKQKLLIISVQSKIRNLWCPDIRQKSSLECFFYRKLSRLVLRFLDIWDQYSAGNVTEGTCSKLKLVSIWDVNYSSWADLIIF